jgi:hypothetical protein
MEPSETCHGVVAFANMYQHVPMTSNDQSKHHHPSHFNTSKAAHISTAKSMHCEIALVCVLQPRISKDRATLGNEMHQLSSSIVDMEGEPATGANVEGLHRPINLTSQPEEGTMCDKVACAIT